MTEHDEQDHHDEQHDQQPHEGHDEQDHHAAQPGPGQQQPGADSTGDIVIDSALQDLRDAPADDLDAQTEAGQRVQQTLQARLGELGGE